MPKSIRKIFTDTVIVLTAITVFVITYNIYRYVDMRAVIDYYMAPKETERLSKPVRAKGLILTNAYGLGNQLFIYAAALHFKRKFGIAVYLIHDPTTKEHTTKDYRKMFKDVEEIDATDPRVVDATPFKFSKLNAKAYTDDNEIPVDKNVYIRIGVNLFHNFKKIRNIIPEVKYNILSVLQPMYSMKVINNPNTSAFIHIRRGDFKYYMFGQLMLSASYYNSGLSVLDANDKVETIYIISNDIPWCKQQIWNTHKKIVYFDDPDELKTLYLMSQCWAGAVISRSTFSLWGVFLGAYGKTDSIVYSRSVHFLEDLPKTWITL